MEFLWIAFWVTIAFWLAQAVLSFKEGTFSLGQLLERKVAVNYYGRYRWQHLPMTFLNNWAVSVGDLFFLSVFNGLVMPYLWLPDGWYWKYPLCLLCAIVATWIFHKAWWRHDENLGHVFISWYKSGRQEKKWMNDITSAGKVHYCFMLFQMFILGLFILTSMPEIVVWWACVLLSVFVIIQNAQAYFIQWGAAFTSFFLALLELFVIWTIAIFKIVLVYKICSIFV